jgi:hypothetical protein
VSEPLFRVLRSKSISAKDEVIATGLTYSEARAMAERLDREYTEKVIAEGGHYSSWTATLHFPEREDTKPRRMS